MSQTVAHLSTCLPCKVWRRNFHPSWSRNWAPGPRFSPGPYMIGIFKHQPPAFFTLARVYPLLTHFLHSSIPVFPSFFLHTDKNGEMTGFIIGDKMPLTRDIVSPVRPVVRNTPPTGQSRVCQPPAQRQVLSGMPHNTAYTHIPIYLYTNGAGWKDITARIHINCSCCQLAEWS